MSSTRLCFFWLPKKINLAAKLNSLNKSIQRVQNILPVWTQMVKVKVTQSCPTLCDPMDNTVHGILQGRILEWAAIPFFRGSSKPRDQTQVSCIAGRFFTVWATRETCLFILLHLTFCYAIFINHRLNHAPSLQVSVKFSSWNKNSLEKMWIRSNIYDKVLWFWSCSCSRWVNNAKMRWTNSTHQSPRAGT